MKQTVELTHEIFSADEVVNIGKEVFQGDLGTLKAEVAFTLDGEAAVLSGYTLSITNRAPNGTLLTYVADGSDDTPVSVVGSTATWLLGTFDTLHAGTYTAQIRLCDDTSVVTAVFVRYNVERGVTGVPATAPTLFPTFRAMLDKARQLILDIDKIQAIADQGFTWNTLIGKPEAFPPSTHTHTDIIALANAAQTTADEAETKVDAALVTLTGKADTTVVKQFSLTTTGWSANAPYTQTAAVEGMTVETKAIARMAFPTDRDTALAMKKAYAMVDKMDSTAGGVTACCLTKKPAVNIAVEITILG